MKRTLNVLVVFILLFKIELTVAQDQFIDTNFGVSNGYTFYDDSEVVRNNAFTDMVEYNEDLYVSSIDTNGNFYILKYNSQGILDTTFGEDGRVDIMDRSFYAAIARNLGYLTITHDEKLLFVNTAGTPFGENNNVLATKLNLDGTLDESYGTNGQYFTDFNSGVTILNVHETELNEVVVIGYNTSLSAPDYVQNIIVLKLDSQGNLDESFGDDGLIRLLYDNENYIPEYAFYKDQSAYVLFNDSSNDAYIAKYDTDTMSYDSSFGIDGELEINNFDQNENATTFMVDDNNSIYISGSKYTGNDLEYELFIYKYTNSILDSSFGNGGLVYFKIADTSNPSSYTIKQHDDKLLVTGSIYIWFSESYIRTLFTQYNMDGSLDTDFGENGIIINTLFDDVSIANDYINYEDSIITCGLCTNEGESQPCLIKYLKKEEVLSNNNFETEVFSAFPNPVDDILNINTNNNINDIDVYDITGRLILKSYKTTQNKIDLKGLNPGQYIVKAHSLNQIYNFRIQKN